MSSPLLLLCAPAVLAAYVAWQLFGPAPKPVHHQRSVAVGEAQKGEGAPRRNIRYASHLVTTKDEGQTTVPQLMRATIERFGSNPALGARHTVKTVQKEVTVKVDGKDVKRMHNIPWQTPYEWQTFEQMGQAMSDLGTGLLECTSTPLSFGSKVAFFAATRPEWQVSAQAAFENGLVVVTVYPSLGPDALSFCLNQTNATHLLTQVSLLDTVLKTKGQLNGALRCIVYLDELEPGKRVEYEKAFGLELVAWKDVLARGQQRNRSGEANIAARRQPQPDDHACIMYTSGSTGQPKGVIMSHANIVAAIGGIGRIPPEPICERDVYIAYLPLAHVLELTAEMTVLAYGGCLGYSSPTTLRDDGVCDEQGRPAGDLGQLRPTLMAAVPLILDRLRAGVQEQVAKSGFVKRNMFNLAFRIKKRRYLRGDPSPLLDRLVFKNVAAKFGGRLRYLLSGGAPLSGETHQFIAICVGAPVMQGYGLTESLCGGTITHPDDRTTGNAGGPVACCQLKLVDEPEMGYTSQDQPKPRGQIYIGGPNISLGYYEQPELTAEAYVTGADGVRYFATGDIGQWEDDGTLKIIDRKKDLVKLSHGEYIAVGALESKYAHCPLVDNICVIGDSEHGAPIALVSPNHDKLRALGKEMGKTGSVDQLCDDPAVISEVLHRLQAEARANKLQKWEVVAALKLYSHPWTPQSGLLTEAMKIKRHEIKRHFKADIDKLYEHVA